MSGVLSEKLHSDNLKAYRERRRRLGFYTSPKPLSPLSPVPLGPSEPSELDQLKQKLAERDAAIDALCCSIQQHVNHWDYSGHKIANAVAKAHGISFRKMLSKSREKHLVRARQHAMWEMREHTQLSLPQIGIILGDLDHTTVLWGIRRHQARIDSGEVR